MQKAREALEIYAPLAHRLGIHLKWVPRISLETLHPRKYAEIKTMVTSGADREEHVREASMILQREPTRREFGADPGRAKHSTHLRQDGEEGSRVQRDYDLTAMRVLVERPGGGDA